MSANSKSQAVSAPEKTYFEQQRELLVGEIATNLENVLQNLNKLNRGLEGIIAVGNEFNQVEGLWAHFESVMTQHPDAQKTEDTESR